MSLTGSLRLAALVETNAASRDVEALGLGQIYELKGVTGNERGGKEVILVLKCRKLEWKFRG